MSRERPADSLRQIEIDTGFLQQHPATVLYSSGLTRVLCAATLEQGVPGFLEGSNKGWATAEYDLLPASVGSRRSRERGGKLSGRTQEIQRLIGRSLRAVLDLEKLTGWTLKIDCDVLQADGGTRTASVNGAYIASVIALQKALADGSLAEQPLVEAIGAISVGIVGDDILLDLDYSEDSRANVDFNVVQTEGGRFLEVQGTAEGEPFSREQLDRLLDLAATGIEEIISRQKELIAQLD
ncbi:MAG: ribonuclease PH [Planctomycetota bacterium]